MQSVQAKIPPSQTVIDINGCSSNKSKGDSCGYCKGSKKDKGHSQWGLTSHKMTVDDYQKLMDRGWRRCGGYYYKFDFEGSCCQPFTIKLDTKEYEISKSQKKVLKKFNKFLLGEIDMTGKKIEQPMKIEKEENKDGQGGAEEFKRDERNFRNTIIKSVIQEVLTKGSSEIREQFACLDEMEINEIIEGSIIN